jgi:hypothetical protein
MKKPVSERPAKCDSVSNRVDARRLKPGFFYPSPKSTGDV